MKSYNANSVTDYVEQFPKYVDHLSLTANVAKSYTVPTGYKIMILNSSVTFYMAGEGGTAVVPSGDVTNGTGSIPSSGGKFDCSRMGGKVISIISPYACNIGILLYK